MGARSPISTSMPFCLRAEPGSTLDYLSEKTKRDWVVLLIRFLHPHKYPKCQKRRQQNEVRRSPDRQIVERRS
jgi:hypothetical protein